MEPVVNATGGSSSSSTDTLEDQPAMARKGSLVPTAWQDQVRAIGASECREAGLSLSHAFAADHLSKYLLEADDMSHISDERLWELHVLFMTATVAAHCHRGIVTTIGPDYDAVALWLPPGKDVDDWWTILRSGMWKLHYKLSSEGRRRYYREMVPLLHLTKCEVMGDQNGNCYYLMYIGTKPNARGRGYAGKLLGDMIKRADAEKRPIYLESSSAQCNAYYAKFGFDFKKDIFIGRGQDTVRLSIMVREPPRSVMN